MTATEPLGDSEQVLEGWITVGHEERSFRPCARNTALWLAGSSPALHEVLQVYRRVLPNFPPYTPLFVVIAGRLAAKTAEGFGAQYDGTFVATQLVRLWSAGQCGDRPKSRR